MAMARAGRTSSAGSSASHTGQACWTGPSASSRRTACGCPGCPATAITRRSTRARAATPGLASALTGSQKPVGLPDGFDSEKALELFTVSPEVFMTGPSRAVPADRGRRRVTRRDFVAAHFRPGAQPAGHGFTEQNRLNGTAYYVHDTPAVRFIALDTNCLAGGADGCLDRQQARWLADRLAEVHSRRRGPAGDEVRTGAADRLVVLFSHHGLDTLTNTRQAHLGPGGEPLLPAAEFLALLHQFPNVVLWLNGHTHTNAIRAGATRPTGPAGSGR